MIKGVYLASLSGDNWFEEERMEVGSAMVPSLERQSSIENEPRTLNISQIQNAREAALYVVSTRSMEEALRIFTAGLTPVINCSKDNEEDNMEYDYEDFEDCCSSNQIRDIESAPF